MHKTDFAAIIYIYIYMTKHAESATQELTGRRLTSEDVVSALRASGPDAYISEQEAGCYIIDGHFDLQVAIQMLSRMLERHVKRAAS
jgi:hypothetical protein